MKTTCLVSNFNYAAFIGEALESIFAQTRPFDEIIIVDDGSVDNSLDVIRTKVQDRANVKVIAKANEGQLSCFNEGFLASSGELIFFLDSDDLYTPSYVERAVDFYRRNRDCEFLSTATQEFGKSDAMVHFIKDYCPETGDMGFSLLKTLYGKKWIGTATSTLSARRSILERFLPLKLTAEWRVSADICLGYGASLVGARKYYLPEPFIKYRVHDRNNFTGRAHTEGDKFKMQLKIERLTHHILRGNFYLNDFGKLILMEYRSIPCPDYRNTRFYLNLANNSNMFPEDRKKMRRKIYKRYGKHLLRQVASLLSKKAR